MVEEQKIIKEMYQYAHENNIPIMQEDGLEFLTNYIKENNVKNILEIGTAIAYSTCRMALLDKDISITTIERDKERYEEAKKNVASLKLEKQINLIYGDAETIELAGSYDLIFIDAAKAQNEKFFEKFKQNLTSYGTIITDNLNFHGLVAQDEKTIESRNVRGIVRKIKSYINFLKENTSFTTTFYDIGDGISVSIPKER